jgi:hypothetical protein
MRIAAATILSLFVAGCAAAQPTSTTSEPPKQYTIGKFSLIHACPERNATTGCDYISDQTVTVIETSRSYIGQEYAKINHSKGTGWASLLLLESAHDGELRRVKKEHETRARVQTAKDRCNKLGGVGVGFTAQQVRASCWGKPERINTTTTTSGDHEQWVYSGGYIYLRNGIVTSIQTGTAPR